MISTGHIAAPSFPAALYVPHACLHPPLRSRASGTARRQFGTTYRICMQQQRQDPALSAGKASPSLVEGQGGWSQQWSATFVGLCAAAIAICYADRANIADAIIPMSQQMGWSRTVEGSILSSFFLGYGTTQILGGALADKFGGKRVLTGAILLWSLATLLTPTSAMLGVGPLVITRILMGVGEGPAFPAIHSMISRAVLPEYQSTAVGAVTAASYVGSVAAFAASPYLIQTSSWESVFHVFACLGLVFVPVWALFPGLPLEPLRVEGAASEVPSGELAGWEALQDLQAEVQALLQRREVLAIVVAQYTQSWGLYGVMNWLPSYIEHQFGVSVSDLANFTVLPYVLQGGIGLAAGVIADRQIANGMPVRQCRQYMQGFGMVLPAAALCASATLAHSAEDATAFLTLGLGASALTLAGVSVNHLDVAPKRAGLVFGIGNTAGTLGGFVSVAGCGWLQEITDSWPTVLGVIAAHYVVGALVWCSWVGADDVTEATTKT